MRAVGVQCPGGPSHYVKRNGFFRIEYNRQLVRRYFCKTCVKSFSIRTIKSDYQQRKPYLNTLIQKMLCSGMTMRGIGRALRINRKTVTRKFEWLSEQKRPLPIELITEEIQFDELETIEHTKCKPLSILVMVNQRGVPLSLKVAQMPAKGLLSHLSKKKYGPRKDERAKILTESLLSIPPLPRVFKTDKKPEYATAIRALHPSSKHHSYNRSQKEKLISRLHELRNKKKFDPLFYVNHMCARLRADIRRLTRRSWCTTKKVENLQRHLNIYLNYRWAEVTL